MAGTKMNLPYTDTITPLPEGAIFASLTESFRSAIKASTFATVIFYHSRGHSREKQETGAESKRYKNFDAETSERIKDGPRQ